MPSPVGHMMAGMAAGWLVAGAPRGFAWRRGGVREAIAFGALGALPDVDLIFGTHSGPTHSLGAAAILAVAVLVARGAMGIRGGACTPASCFAAYASHVLLDWLATDSSPPIGIMALWPLSHRYYESDLHLFLAISRRYLQGWRFVRQNGFALARELVILIPVLGLVVLTRERR